MSERVKAEPKRPFIIDAIQNHILIRVAFGPRYSIEIEPHIYGTAAGGMELLYGWVVAGPGADDWALETIDHAIVEPVQRAFKGSRSGYNRRHSQFEEIFSAL